MTKGIKRSDDELNAVIEFIKERGKVTIGDLKEYLHTNPNGVLNRLLMDKRIEKIQVRKRVPFTSGPFLRKSTIRKINYYRVIDTS
jgi:Mn-dependent DtxR family transcriptional regulator